MISERYSVEENPCTIVVGAIGVDGWDPSERGVGGRRQSRLVGYLSKALHNKISDHQASYFRSPKPTFTAASQSLRPASKRHLHSRLARGFAQRAASTVVMNVGGGGAKDTLFAGSTIVLSDVQRCVRVGELEKGEGELELDFSMNHLV